MKIILHNHSVSTKISDLLVVLFSIAYFLVEKNKEKKTEISDVSIYPTEFYE